MIPFARAIEVSTSGDEWSADNLLGISLVQLPRATHLEHAERLSARDSMTQSRRPTIGAEGEPCTTTHPEYVGRTH